MSNTTIFTSARWDNVPRAEVDFALVWVILKTPRIAERRTATPLGLENSYLLTRRAVISLTLASFALTPTSLASFHIPEREQYQMLCKTTYPPSTSSTESDPPFRPATKTRSEGKPTRLDDAFGDASPRPAANPGPQNSPTTEIYSVFLSFDSLLNVRLLYRFNLLSLGCINDIAAIFQISARSCSRMISSLPHLSLWEASVPLKRRP